MDRFWSKVDKDADGGHWIWTAGKCKGYGSFRLEGKAPYAHHLSLLWAIGEGFPGALALHKCDTPACVNPDHLYWGTHADNARDKMERGRWAGGGYKGMNAGEKQGRSKLKDEQVLEIRRLHAEEGASQSSLAGKFGVHQASISRILRRMTWTHI